jgi:tRNA pseudouridine55 synthase
MLPLCFGEATKICAYLLEANKTYRVTARLGEATDTGDADGQINATAVVPDLERKDWEALLAAFLGDTEQVPPMYSALRKNGKRLYELARMGQVVERKARPVRIEEISLLEVSGSRLVFRVHCSKGTYIRTLVEDIAKLAGTVAHTARLHRESVGGFRAEDMLDMSGAERAAEAGPAALRERLLPADAALTGWRECQLSAGDIEHFCGGRAVATNIAGEGLVKVYSADQNFLGIGELTADGQVTPRRVFKRLDGVG